MSSFGALIAKLQYVKHFAFFLGHPVDQSLMSSQHDNNLFVEEWQIYPELR